MLEKGGKTIDKLKQFFIDFWYLISPLFGFLGELFDILEVEFLQKIFYLLSIYCLWLGIREFKKKNKRKIKQPMKPQAQRTVEQSLDPEKQVKMLVENERKIRKGLKIMFKWFKNNKGAIAQIGTGLLAVVTPFIPQISDLVIWGEIKVIPVLFGVLTIVIGSLSYPLTSSSLQEAINNLKATIKGAKVTKEDKQKLEDIKFFKNEIKVIEKELKSLEKEYASSESEYARAKRYGLSISHDAERKHNEYIASKNSRENAKKQLEDKLAVLDR